MKTTFQFLLIILTILKINSQLHSQDPSKTDTNFPDDPLPVEPTNPIGGPTEPIDLPGNPIPVEPIHPIGGPTEPIEPINLPGNPIPVEPINPIGGPSEPYDPLQKALEILGQLTLEEASTVPLEILNEFFPQLNPLINPPPSTNDKDLPLVEEDLPEDFIEGGFPGGYPGHELPFEQLPEHLFPDIFPGDDLFDDINFDSLPPIDYNKKDKKKFLP